MKDLGAAKKILDMEIPRDRKANAISWKASLQSIAALSTTEAEYVAATEGVNEATQLRGLVTELGVPQGTTMVFLDSQSAIHLTKNDNYHSKTKHISVKYHYSIDTAAAGEIVVRKVHTSENLVDMLTESLLIAKFKHRLDLAGAHNILLPSGGLPFGALPFGVLCRCSRGGVTN